MERKIGSGDESALVQKSRDLDRAWLVVTRPKNYPADVVQKASSLLSDTREKTLKSVRQHHGRVPDDLKKAFLGLLHYEGPFGADPPKNVRQN